MKKTRDRMNRVLALILSVALMVSTAGCANIGKSGSVAVISTQQEFSDELIKNLKAYADNLLKYGRDQSKKTPLFYDGINIETKEPLIWRNFDGKEYVPSNMAVQQNMFRFLDGMTAVTGDKKYRKAAQDAIKYMFKNQASSLGLLYWGGHAFVDINTQKPTHPSDESLFHELKFDLPFYDLLYATDKKSSSKFVEGFWTSHIKNWNRLEFNRHGYYTKAEESIWNEPPKDKYEVGYATKSLTFISSAADLIYAAAKDFEYSGNENSFKWAKALAKQYHDIANKDTGLWGSVYTYYLGTLDGKPHVNDKAKEQFGEAFDGKIWDTTLILKEQARMVYGEYATSLLLISEDLQGVDSTFKEYAINGLKSFAKCAYLPEEGRFMPILTDGTDLTGYTLDAEGSYGRKGSTLEHYADNGELLLSYVMGALCSGDKELWETARSLARVAGLGDIGSEPGKDVSLNYFQSTNNIFYLETLLRLYEKTKNDTYLTLAANIGKTICETKYKDGYFKMDIEDRYITFDGREQVAVLKLYAYLTGKLDAVKYNPVSSICVLDGGYMDEFGVKKQYLGYAELLRFLNKKI